VEQESLADAFRRIGLRPGPTLEELEQMTPEQRTRAFEASSITTQEQFDQLPQWFRDRLRRRGEDLVARREAEQTAQSRPHAS
jgi:hypothetical protein